MNPGSVREELNNARRQLRQWMTAYYAEAHPVVPDTEYDDLARRVRELEQGNPHLRDWDSPLTAVSPPLLDPFPSRAHTVPMLSLSNVYSMEELHDWERSLLRLLPGETPVYLAELKIDGLAISIQYREGQLDSAVTRGDGTVGEEVTRNIKTVRGLPHSLREPLSLEVRGEVYYTIADFEQVNRQRERMGEAAFKNPRNAAAGTLRMLNTAQVGQRGLHIAIHGLVSESPRNSGYETLQWLKGLGLPVSEPALLFSALEEIEAYYTRTLEERHALPFHIDGLVVKVDQMPLRERAGFTSRSPRWAVALKFGAEQTVTTLDAVEIGVGRTGVLTPIARLAPVELGGTTVSRATLHNYDQIGRLGLRVGDRVILEKGGDIIPKVVAVVEGGSGNRTPIAPPAACPSCGAAPVRLEGEVDYFCLNPACPAQRAERIRHFVSRQAMDIESLGPALIEQLLQTGRIETFADLYSLQVEELQELERMGKKSAANVIQGISDSRKNPLDKFLHGLGIRFVGERTARVLASQFQTLAALRGASREDFEDVNEIGAVIAKSLYNFFRDDQQQALIDRCIALGVDPAVVDRPGGGGPLAGKAVVITGTLAAPRTQWKERLVRAGANVKGSISKKTDYLLAGENPGSKLDAAREHQVTVLNEAQMAELLEQT